MARATTSNPSDFSDRIQTYFNPKLLKALAYNLVLAQFADKKAYPVNGSTIRFYRPRAASTAQVHGALTEGTKPTTLAEVAVGHKDVTLAQRGGLAEITDLAEATDIIDTLALYVETMGADAALDLDSVIRNAIQPGSGVTAFDNTYGTKYFERFAGVTNTGDSSTDFDTLDALSAANGKITRAVALGCITRLKTSRVPTFNGKYVAAVSEPVLADIRQDSDWIAAATNVDTKMLYNNEEFSLDGARYVRHDNPFIEGGTYGTYSATGSGATAGGANYTTLFIGMHAYGCPEATDKRAGGSPKAPRMIVLTDPDKSDPLGQIATIGWKARYGAAALITDVTDEVPHYVTLRSKATFVG